MTPFFMWFLFSAGLGWSVSRRKWGFAAFFAAMLGWEAVVQIAVSLTQIAIATLSGGAAAHTGALTNF